MGVVLLDHKVFMVEGISIPYDIKLNPRLKYMRVEISASGMTVSVPGKAYFCRIEEFLRCREAWIYEHYKKYLDEGSNGRCDFETALYRGRECSVVIHDTDKKRVKVKFDGEKFEVYIERAMEGQTRVSAVRDALEALYRKMARDIVDEKLKTLSRIIGVSYNNFRIKDHKTRWGSCSGKGNLNFNWRLVLVPDWVMDYVIVHELCHLKFMNHSKDFWNMVSLYMPNYNDARKLLVEYSSRIRM
jgi:predicted metal-dependent hydrolase